MIVTLEVLRIPMANVLYVCLAPHPDWGTTKKSCLLESYSCQLLTYAVIVPLKSTVVNYVLYIFDNLQAMQQSIYTRL